MDTRDEASPVIRIMYVDDRESNYWILDKKLRKEAADFVVDWARGVDDALEMLHERHYDSLIVDFDLNHGKGGISLLTSVRFEFPLLPVFILSSQSDEEVAAEVFRAGASDFFIRKIGFAFFQRLANAIRNSVERFRVEEQKEHFKALFNEAINSSPTPVFIVDTNHRIIYWNRACEELTGLTLENVSDTDAYRRVFKPLTPGVENLPDIILGRKLDELSDTTPVKRKTPYSCGAEGYYEISGQKKRYLRMAASAVRDGIGTLKAVIQTVEDLTENMQAREELAQKNEQFLAIIKNSPVTIYIHQDNRFKLFNTRLPEFTGYTPEELEKINVWDLAHPDDVEFLKENALKRVEGKPAPAHYHFRGVMKDGRVLNLIGYFTMVTYDNRPAILGQIIEAWEMKDGSQ